MSTTRTIMLGKRTFDIPELPFSVSIDVYPLCQKLVDPKPDADGIDNNVDARILRTLKSGGSIWLSRDELVDLAEIAFLACTAAEPDFTRKEFDALTITPLQLAMSFPPIKIQTGAWVIGTAEEDPDQGEESGAEKPLT